MIGASVEFVRPVGLIAMSRTVMPAVLPVDLRSRLSGSLSLVEPTGTDNFGDPDIRRALGRVEVLLTGWECPRLTPEVLDAAPRLRAVVHAAGSVKALVGPEVFARGILVSSAADANADPVADFTLAAITLAGKRAFALAKAYESGRYAAFRDRHGNDGRTVGVVGASRIGRRVIVRLVSAGYRVLVADPHAPTAEITALGGEPADLDDLCRRSDIVTLHAPALPETRHLFDAERLALLPDGAMLVNTARGSLVDTEALVRACASGRIDAVLDVTDPEPLPAGHPLFGLPNVWLTPHLAGVQGSECRRLGAFAVAEVERYVVGVPMLGLVHPEQLATLA
jgi:phosphoglycerate dehydrogenase-like enzyme